MPRTSLPRLSSTHQNLGSQLGALRAERVRSTARRPPAKPRRVGQNSRKALDQLGKGDNLVVTEWDRANSFDGRRRSARRSMLLAGIAGKFGNDAVDTEKVDFA